MMLSPTDPPSESPLTTAIELQLLKFDLHNTVFRREYAVPTEWAEFRIDIVMCVGQRRIGIECDGADFHDDFRDELRDSLILGSGIVDTMWRLPGADIHNHLHDCLCLISIYDGFVFDERTRTVFLSQGSEAVLTHTPESHESILLVVDTDRLPNRSGYINLIRRTNQNLYSPVRQHWRKLYKYALAHRGMTFAQLHATRLQENDQLFW